MAAADDRHDARSDGANRAAEKGKHPVLFVLDEFAVLDHMESIEKAAGQIAGFGVKLWPVIQDLTQLQRDYKEAWETFMGNAGLMTFFGNTDLTTPNIFRTAGRNRSHPHGHERLGKLAAHGRGKRPGFSRRPCRADSRSSMRA